MMLKIEQASCTEDNYLSTIKFMIAYSSMSFGAVHLFELRIINALVSVKLLNDLNSEESYKGGERSTKHIIWLWTLHLMRQLCSMLSTESDFTYPVLEFFTTYEDRIIEVLRFKGYRDNSQQYRTVTIARLEEIEHCVNLISYLLMNVDQWKIYKDDQFQRIINILCSHTIVLFKSNISLSDAFIPVSLFEQYIESLSENFFHEDYKSGSDIALANKVSVGSESQVSQTAKNAILGKIVTSIRTPMKGEYSASDFSELEHDKYSRRPYRASTLGSINLKDYSPNGFMLKVELSLIKIAMMLLRSMYLILKMELKLGKNSFFLQELSYYNERTSEPNLYLLCGNLFDWIQFWQNCCKKWTSKFTSANRLNKVLNGALMTTDNLIDSGIEIIDALDICWAASDLGLLLSMQLLKAVHFANEDDYSKSYLERSDKRIIQNIKKFSEEAKNLTKEKDNVLELSQKMNKNSLSKSDYFLAKIH